MFLSLYPLFPLCRIGTVNVERRACLKRCLQCAAAFGDADWTCPTCNFAPTSVAGYLAFAPALAGGGEGYQDSYFDELARLEAANFWFRARNQLILWALRKHLKDAQNFLEIGCGTGFVLSGIAQAFPQMSLNGSEVSTNGLVHAAQRIPQANFFQMDARAIPFEAEFDTIGAFDVIEHINEDEAANRYGPTIQPPGQWQRRSRRRRPFAFCAVHVLTDGEEVG